MSAAAFGKEYMARFSDAQLLSAGLLDEPIPEPTSLALLGLGAAGLLVRRRK